MNNSQTPTAGSNDAMEERPAHSPAPGSQSAKGGNRDIDMDDLFADILPRHKRVEEWLERVNKFPWRDEDVDLEKLMLEAFTLGKQLALSAFDPVGLKKNDRVSLQQQVAMLALKSEAVDRQDVVQSVAQAIQDSGISIEVGPEIKVTDLPVAYYDRQRHSFLIQAAGGEYQSVSEGAVRRRLAIHGISDRLSADGSPSPADRWIDERIHFDGVDWAGPLAGHQAGVCQINGSKILVTSSFSLIEPKEYFEGSCDHVFGVVEGLLCGDSGSREQMAKPYCCFLNYLQKSYLNLKAGQCYGSLAVFLCGPPDIGKSLLIHLIVLPLLGGRQGNAYLYVSGQSSFNDELMSKEVWVIDDGVPLSDYAARKRFGGMLKQAVAGNDVPCHPKGKPQMTLPLYRRLLIALNPEDMETLPPLAESIGDKYMLLKTKKFAMPEGCMSLPQIKDRPAFAEKIRQELPHFLGWLLEQDLSAYDERRFGVVPYKDHDLAVDHSEVSGLDTKFQVLQSILFEDIERDAVEMKTSTIWIDLISHRKKDLAKDLFKNSIILGLALSELAHSSRYRHLVSKRIVNGCSVWTIRQEPVEVHEHPSPPDGQYRDMESDLRK